ncbi:MAG: HK97 family phage prohead protease [Shewanella sp.]
MQVKLGVGAKLSELKFAESGGGYSFEGYASVFGNVDSAEDIITPGAYSAAIRTQKRKPLMLVNHVGYGTAGLPIGKYTEWYEDSKGLVVKGELTPGHTTAENIRASMKHGTLDGLSVAIGFFKEDYEIDQTTKVRTIKNIREVPEISIVTFPANDLARVDIESVKGELENLSTEREFERFLRDAGGLSNALSTALTARAKSIFRQGELAQKDAEAKVFEQLAQRIAANLETHLRN